MKSILTLSLVIASTFSTLLSATPFAANEPHGADMFKTLVYCRDARPIMDAGLIVSVRTGGFAGITQITIADQSIMGPRPFGNAIVTDYGRLSQGTVIYSSADVVLQISNEIPQNSRITANENARKARIIGYLNERPFAHDLICVPSK